jgi:uncharacterized protein YyaL (SSP411 family)
MIAIVVAPLALAAEPAVAGPTPHATAPPGDDRARFGRMCEQVAAAYDTARGGFVGKDGAPSESAVELALLLGRDRSGGEWKRRALATIDGTRALMDTTSGGFVTRPRRNGGDADAFDVRTDVNARRLANLLTAWRNSGQASYRRDAERVAGFAERVLLDGRGGFVTAQVGDRTLEPASNGIAIHAWLTWGAATGDPGTRDFALRSLDRVWESCFDPLGVLLRHGTFGEVVLFPQLVDQVEMGRALVLAYQWCGRKRDLERARGLAQVVLEKFEDRTRGGFMTQARPKKDGTIRRAARVEEENARAARFLAELAAATGDAAFREAARRTWAAFEKEPKAADLESADWALALSAVLAPDTPAPPVWRPAASAAPVTPRVIRFRTGRR